jgi:hypothetical protein
MSERRISSGKLEYLFFLYRYNEIARKDTDFNMIEIISAISGVFEINRGTKTLISILVGEVYIEFQ